MKVAAILMVVVLAFSIVGCGKKRVPPVDEAAQREAAERAAAEAAKQKQLPERETPPVVPVRPEDVKLDNIYFEFDKYDLTPQARTALNKNARTMMEYPDFNILIEGNCDERGTEEYNLALGEKRALAARDYLEGFGIARDRMSVISYGEEKPVDPRHNEEAWAKNRRDVFVVTK
jgi:peptidoglycan-associated lipoprotein